MINKGGGVAKLFIVSRYLLLIWGDTGDIYCI